MSVSKNKNILFGIITCLLLVVAFEALCYLAYRIGPQSVLGWQYYDEAFHDLKPARGPAGWDAYGASPRPSNRTYAHQCVTTYGDSFTHGDEVTHDEAWTRGASDLLGCEVVNHGVGGFGTDQAYMRYTDTAPQTPVVLLGVYQEMLRRNLSASWLFYGMQPGATIKPYFVLDAAGLHHVPMPTDMAARNVKAYHADDRYYQPVRMDFPYSLALLRAVYYRASKPAVSKTRMLPPETAYEDTQAIALQLALTDRLRTEARQNGQRLAVVFFPTADQAMQGVYPYAGLLRNIAAAHPEDCLIDPGPALHAASEREGRPLAAPVGHFDATGNRVIAQVVATALRACGFVNQND